jgi:glycosyltransferase involved in cell wall biosynthesis
MTKNEPKRILIFSLAYTPFVGGAELAIRHITDRLDPDRWVFDMVTLRFDARLPAYERIGNVNVYRLGFARKGATIADTFRLPLSLNKYWFPFGALFQALRLHRKYHYAAVWSLMANYAGFAGLFFKLSKPTIPFVLTLQEGDPIEHIMRRVGFLRPLFRQIFIRADRVQTISRFLAEFAETMGAQPSYIVVIPNGVPAAFAKKVARVELASARQTMGKKSRDKLVITTSRLVHKNGIDIILHALVLLPPTVKLAVLGDGPERERLLKLTDECKLTSRVVFLSEVAHDTLPAYLQAADIFVRPSRSEGLGSSFLEAMAAGLPVIATPVGGIPDFLTDRETGLFCEVDSPERLAEQIAVLIRDRALRAHIIRNARKLITERYDWAIVAKRIDREVFTPILKN